MSIDKKIIANTLSLSLLIGCVASTGTSTPIDEEVLQANSITYTLDMYDKYSYKKPEYKLLSEKVDTKNPSMDIRAIDCFVYDNLPYNSDECIIFRRNNKERFYSEVNFFDYKRFLPKNSVVKTDTDFLLLVNKYEEYKDNKLESCDKIHKNNSLTSSEKDEKYTQCLSDNKNKKNKIEELLKSYISEGGLEKEKNKMKSIVSDCKQAKEQVLKYKENYNKCNEDIKSKVDNYKKSIGYDKLHNLDSYKVVDFAKDGVMIKIDYDDAVLLSVFTGASNNINKLYFVYTKDTNYATGDYFRDGGLYYIKDGVYKYTTVTGATNSIHAFKPTKYKIKDVENKIREIAEIKNTCGKSDYTYKDFLKDKTITECKNYDNSYLYCYKDGDKEKCFKEKDEVIIPY